MLLDALLAGRWDIFQMALRHLVLPAVTLATVPLAIIARVTRSSVVEVLHADFIRTARAKGVGRARLLMRHALPAAMVPILGLLGIQLATLLAGAVLTESVFNWPGLGRYVTEATTRKDYNALQGAVLLLSGVFVFVNFCTDLLCGWFDPRIRLDGEGSI
ncbi:MAG: ABC transporter permease [Planctomycetota bacterium]